MFRRKILAAIGFLTMAGMLIGISACTSAEVQALQGQLKNVDSVTGTVTVTLKDGTTQTFNFKDVKVDMIRQALGSATIEVGDNVTVRIRQNHVEDVETRYAEVEGVIKTVNADNVVITSDGTDVTLKVNAQTNIRVGDNTSAALGDLKPGQEAEAKYDVSSMTAVRIVAHTQDEGHGRLAQAEGIVAAVGTGNVTIGFGSGDNVTVNVIAGTIIKIKGDRTGSLQDIKVGQRIHASYDKTTGNASRLTLQNGGGPGKNGEDGRGQSNQDGQNKQGEDRQNGGPQSTSGNRQDGRGN